MEFERNRYLNELIDRKGNRLVKIITGIRRCGKSYLLNNIFYNYLLSTGIKKERIIKFAFDSEEDIVKLDKYLPNEKTIILKNKIEYVNQKKFLLFLEEQTSSDSKEYYLLLDEVQNLYRFESVLNSLLRHDNYDIYVTGSNSKFLSTDVITEFSDRGDEIHMLPVSFKEYMSGCNLHIKDAYKEYLYYGGLPLVQIRKNDEQKINELDNATNNLYLSDIINRHCIQNDSILKDTLMVLSSCVGSPVNPSKLENTFKSVLKKQITDETLNIYLKWFQESYLISKCIRYDIKGRAYVGTPFKVYFEDIGIKNSLLSYREIDETDIIENIVYNELKYRGFKVDVGMVEISVPTDRKDKNGKVIYTKKQLEVDFVANKGNLKIYVQVAYKLGTNEKINQEYRPIRNIPDNFKKIVVVDEDVKPLYDGDGILKVGLLDFLLTDSWM